MDTITRPTRRDGARGLDLTRRDRDLLMALINYRSKTDVAAALGYSDRHLRRLINDLCRRLDVPTSHAAVALAVASAAFNQVR